MQLLKVGFADSALSSKQISGLHVDFFLLCLNVDTVLSDHLLKLLVAGVLLLKLNFLLLLLHLDAKVFALINFLFVLHVTAIYHFLKL